MPVFPLMFGIIESPAQNGGAGLGEARLVALSAHGDKSKGTLAEIIKCVMEP